MGKLVGPYLRMLREQRGLSVRGLAARIPCAPAYISLVERAQREISIGVLYTAILELQGDFAEALFLLAQDAGVPESELASRRCCEDSNDAEKMSSEGEQDDKR